MNMFKRLFACLALALLAQGAFAQDKAPAWLNAESRALQYPNSTYYSGIAYENMAGQPRAVAIQKAEQGARTEALSTILVSLHSVTYFSQFSRMVNDDEDLYEVYKSETRIEIAFNDIPGVMVEHYVKGSEVTAFAYVNRLELMLYYSQRIETMLARIEGTLDNVDQYVSEGEKIRARELAKTAVKYFAELENSQRILVAVGGDAYMQMDRYMEISKRMENALVELKNGTAIYIDCRVNAHGSRYVAFDGELKGRLSTLGCHFADNREQADWVVTVKADVERENKANDIYFVWVDGTVSIRKQATNQTIYTGRISAIEEGHPDGVKGGHTAGYDAALRAAYKEAARIVDNKVTDVIK